MRPQKKPNQHRPFESGFALIITISMMVLLSLLAVGLLSLSAISVRASTAGQASIEARQNARLAMQLALGQLQSLAGQDTRVTATADLLDESNAKLTGVWRSWEGTDRDQTGKPIAPEYGSKEDAGDPTDEAGSSGGRFLGWLASPFAGSDPDINQFEGISQSAAGSGDYVTLIGEGSVENSDERIYTKPTLIDDAKGAIAWWTSGDNAKAMVNVDRMDEPNTTVQWQERVRSNGRPDASVFDLAEVDEMFEEGSIPSNASFQLVNSEAELRRFHDLTSYNRGLLTNTATGGWRRDMSLFAENFRSLSSRNLPLFTNEPGSVQTFSKAQASSHPPNPLIYPWSTYRDSPGGAGWKQVPPICSWTALADYLTQYSDLRSSSASKTVMLSSIAGLSSAERFNFQDQVRRVPQVARIQWIYSLCSAVSDQSNDPRGGTNNWGRHMPALMITPVVTLWNPYNVELTISNFGLDIQETAPLKFAFNVGGRTYRECTLSQIANAGTGYTRFKIRVNQSIKLAPGATQVFGLNDNEPKDNSQASNVVLTPGYNPGGGFLFYGLNSGRTIYADPGDTFSVQSIGYDAMTTESGRQGIGIVYNVRMNGDTNAHRMAYGERELGGDNVVAALYPPLTNTISTTIGEVEGLANRAFASAIFGYRMVTPLSQSPQHRHLYSKGMLQTNPLCFYTEVGHADTAGAATTMAGTGVYHPINAPYDFAFQDVQGWNDTEHIPQFESGSNSGYIVSGVTAGTGLTRCEMAELPTRPLQSLAQLQHFDARNNNPIPPFQFNLIGNSSANPIFAPDQLLVRSNYNNGMCNDDSYMLNHVLFDDWFFSSINQDLRDFGRTAERSLLNVYRDHLEGTRPLANRFYLPAPGAASPSPEEAASSATASRNRETGLYSFETIASKLVVEGMFNINSVSLDAWRALLRQARDLEVPYLNARGSITDGSPSTYSYPRTSIAGDQSTDSSSSESNPLFPNAVEFSGHRAFSEEQIDALAEEIVDEIRKRGPFLSLSEFVNRQVSNDKDLAIAGTIQKALDNLANSGSSGRNPYSTLQSLAVEVTEQPPGVTDYKFPEAALGSSAFGVPGWTRQADILTPIAPIISARDDTFTIRAYGDSRDKSNSSIILARAWCEVTVQRVADYVDGTDSSAILPNSDDMTSDANKRFGRRFEVISFRWLNAELV